MKRLVFAGMNPSKAGWPGGDLTVSKCCGFAWRILGYADHDEVDVVDGGATFSEDRTYRYGLWRVLARRNPFTSEMTRIIRVDLINAFAFVSTDPKGLYAAPDPVGRENSFHVERTIQGADYLIAAWGSLPARPLWLRAHTNALLRKMTDYGEVFALGLTGDGSPSHLSRLPYTSKLLSYRARRVAA